MTTYKRSLFVLLKGLIGAPCAGFVVYLVGCFFTQDMRILLGVAAAITLIIWYISIFSEQIHFTLSDAGELCYYKRGKCRARYDLTRCSAGYRRRSDGTDHTISLRIYDAEGKEHDIDASPLGRSRFEALYAKIKTFIPAGEDEVMRT